MTARSNNASLIYVAESTLGTTPVDDAGWKTFPLAGADGLNMENITTRSNQVRSDRGLSDSIKTGETVAGALPSEFQADQHDDLLEAACMSAFSTGVLKNGSTRQSFTFERNFGDLTNKYIVYAGVRVNGFTLTVSQDDPVTISFETVGLTSDDDNIASLVGAGSLAAVSTNAIMSGADVDEVSIDSVTSYCVESMDLTVTNNMEAKRCFGTPNGAAVDQLEGSFEVSGNMTVATTDASWALLAEKRANTPIPISFDLTDGTNTYQFSIPRAYINFPDPSGQGANTSVMLNISISAAQDETEAATLVITKS